MAELITVYWRDIPAQVIAKAGRTRATRELPERFIKAIDACAMRVGAKDSDAYLAEWRRGTPVPCGDELDTEAQKLFDILDNDYPMDRLKYLIDAEGFAK